MNRGDPAPAGREPIAITGISCRFPGAADPVAFWALLAQGKEALTRWPQERWERAHSDLPGLRPAYDPDSAPWGGFLEDYDCFDPEFFQVSFREAASMDPQQRLILEAAWHVLEDSGTPPEQMSGSRTGVFLGVGSFGYGVLAHCREDQDLYSTMGVTNCLAANRISYHLNLKGPSVVVDTACSSSLVALHWACRSIWSGESDSALAGGVHIQFLPRVTRNFADAGLVSPDGKCRAFDARANGYVRSDGLGLVFLKPLSRALEDGDRIYAVLRGSAVNQDGKSNGLTAPNSHAQREVLAAACDDAGVEPGSVDYVEAQGTATRLGDPIELQALGAVFGEKRPADRRLLIGSVKTNIGHLEAAAGIAGLIKTVLALWNRQIPPHLHFQEPNPHADLARLHLEVATSLTPWPQHGGPARAGVSAFGYGGTNAHLILEEGPRIPRAHPPADRPCHILALSAKESATLVEWIQACAQALEKPLAPALADFCFSMNSGRNQFRHRLAVVAPEREVMVRRLREILAAPEEHLVDPPSPAKPPKIGFLFPGETTLHLQTAATLYQQSPVFRSAVDRCDETLAGSLSERLPRLLQTSPETGPPALSPRTAHPLFFAAQAGMIDLLSAWGIRPSAVLGYGLGEFAAAYAAGVFPLEEGIRLVAERARLLELAGAHHDSTLLIHADGSTLHDVLEPFSGQVAIVGFDSPERTRISGEPEAVSEVSRRLTRQSIPWKILPGVTLPRGDSVAGILPEFLDFAHSVAFDRPRIPWFSSATGERIPGDALAPDYWARQLREPVQFTRSRARFESASIDTLLQVAALPRVMQPDEDLDDDPTGPEDEIQLTPSDPWESLLECLASLFRLGVSVDWEQFDHGYGRRRVFAPLYPFRRRRLWLPPSVKPSSNGSVETLRATIDAFAADTARSPAELRLLEELQEALGNHTDRRAPDTSEAQPPPPPRKGAASGSAASPIPPLEECTRILQECWEELLQMPEAKPNTDFFNAGGDSILTARLITLIRDKLHQDIPPEWILQSPTPARLAEQLVKAALAPSSPAKSDLGCVVPIQLEGSGRPFFWIHAMGGGDAGGFVRFHGLFDDLSGRMGKHRPFYGLRTKGRPFLTVEAMARAFVDDMRRVQPCGPYQLGAYCSSGVVAVEMARLLYAEGHAVGTVAIIDTPAPHGMAEARFRIADTPARLGNVVLWLLDQVRHHPDAFKARLGRGLRIVGQRLLRHQDKEARAADLGLQDVLDMSSYPEAARRYAEAHWEAYRRYQPGKYSGRIDLFLPRVRGLLWANNVRAWKHLAADGLSLHVIPGNHNSMLKEPNVQILAAQLEGCLADD